MSDRYLDFANSRLGNRIASALGLPRPIPLRREPGRSARTATIGGTGRMAAVLAGLGLAAGGETVEALLYDATALASVADTAELYAFFHANLPRVATHGRILLFATPPDDAGNVEAVAVQRGLEGFVRSLAKEVRRAATVQIVYVAPGAEQAAGSTLRFFLADASGFVSGQPIHVAAPVDAPQHRDRIIAITGASRGIGLAIAEAFAAAGAARLVLIDVPAMADDLAQVATRLGGASLAIDVTAEDAPARLVADAKGRGGYDVIVHNAGITRDRTLAKMEAARWNQVMAVNLTAPIRLTQALLAADAIPQGGRIVAVASLSGIAGNAGQTNYALSKAGVIGWIDRLAREVGPRGITANAVAPGFIETQMTAAIPFAIRAAGRRLNSLGQGGQPADVAETIRWLAAPDSGCVNGQTVRVCGQNLLGA